MSTVPFYDLHAITLSEVDELHACLDEVVAGGYFVGGPLVTRFESGFASFLGVREAVGVANGLDAIRLALEAYNIGSGDEVIVPAFTYYATWLGVTQAGATPVPVDCEPHTANLDPAAIEAAITEKTRAIIAVHLYGQAADLLSIRRIADAHNLILIEDAAQSHGAMSNAGMTGTVGDAAAFSFYPTKNLGALGDSGAVVTSDESVAARVRSRRSYGQGASKYDHVDTGWNSRLDPLQAAFLSLHLRKLLEWNARRRQIASMYMDALGQASTAIVGPRDPNGSVWHQFVLLSRDRNGLRAYLDGEGVSSDVHYPYAVHQLVPMRELMNLDSLGKSFPAADSLSRMVTSIPMGPWMSSKQVDQVARALRKVPRNLLID